MSLRVLRIFAGISCVEVIDWTEGCRLEHVPIGGTIRYVLLWLCR